VASLVALRCLAFGGPLSGGRAALQGREKNPLPCHAEQVRGTLTLSLRRGTGTEDASKHPDNVSSAMLLQGVLTKMPPLIDVPSRAEAQQNISRIHNLRRIGEGSAPLLLGGASLLPRTGFHPAYFPTPSRHVSEPERQSSRKGSL
jgi:hypothetical protein